MSDPCIFCKIVSNEIPGDVVYRDDQVTAFRDIQPIASTHILIVPNRHIESTNELEAADEQLMGQLFTVAAKLAKEEGVEKSGYRLVINTGADAGQAVFHIHLHLIGGKKLRQMG